MSCFFEAKKQEVGKYILLHTWHLDSSVKNLEISQKISVLIIFSLKQSTHHKLHLMLILEFNPEIKVIY